MKGIIKNRLREWQIMSLYCNCLIKSEIKKFNALLLNNLNLKEIHMSEEKFDLQATYEKVKVKGKGRPSYHFDIVKIKAMLEQKITWEKIAQEFGVSTHCISRFAKKNGFFVTISSAVRRKINLNPVQLKALIDQNLTWQQIADELGVGINIVKKRAKGFEFVKLSKRWWIDPMQLKALMDQGLAWYQIGVALGISEGTAISLAKELGFLKSASEIDIEKLKALANQKLTWQEIGDALGVHRTIVKLQAKELGIIKLNKKK
jgi:predicted transcriptional regulator